MPRERRSVKLGTYNVNNLFDRFDDPYSFRDDLWSPIATKPKDLREVFNLGQRILHDNPDCLAFQEVENKGILREFNLSHLGGLFSSRNLILIEANDPRSIDVAVCSKLPIGRVITHQYRRESDVSNHIFSRDLLQVKLLTEEMDDVYLTLFVTHLKSKWVNPVLAGAEREEQIEKDNARRKLQATTIAEIIKEQFDHPERERYTVVGDLNDTPDSEYLRPLLNNSSLDLYDVVQELPENKRWTHEYEGERNQFDYILLSPPLKEKLIDGSVTIVHRGHTTGSDHKPLYVDLTYP